MTDIAPAPILVGEGLTLAYDRRRIATDLDVTIPTGQITVIVGPNACGKSTLLRALARLLTPSAGVVRLRERDINGYGAKELARALALLPQSPTAPNGIRVADLVARGRFPHQRMLRQWSDEDERAAAAAMARTGITELAERSIDELSGGQRQRVWLALTLAQDAPVMLLDEPTTFLDIAHQYDVLDLCRHLNRDDGRTLVMVLHDLNQATRYADHLIAMRDGAIVAAGPPTDIMTPRLVRRVFGIDCVVIADPVTGTPLVVPVPSRAQSPLG